MAVHIDPKDAFVHLVYDYRCLVRAEYIYRNSPANLQLPELGTIARNAVLSKLRSLVDFYTKTPARPPRDTDILFSEYFSGSVDPILKASLESIKNSIEVNDLHLTVWRDVSYRSAHSDPARQRVEWNDDQSKMVDDMIDALRQVLPSLDSKWQTAFGLLHKTCLSVLATGSGWETNLNQEEIEAYLIRLGL